MPDKQEDVQKDLDAMKKSYEKSTGMKVVQPPQPVQGKTEFAKDKKFKDGQP